MQTSLFNTESYFGDRPTTYVIRVKTEIPSTTMSRRYHIDEVYLSSSSDRHDAIQAVKQMATEAVSFEVMMGYPV